MLSEFARYIAQKEQPISMDNCLCFARLVIRGCGQLLYKRFHHRKIITEIKRQYNERKNYLLATFRYANYKVSITSDIWTTDKHGLVWEAWKMIKLISWSTGKGMQLPIQHWR
jgi:hypothetical protein